ncbi:ribbon-helix-helix domain-containing protein [Neobacillus ginsengisoli]|uniref:DNA-binding protein n=1 Tax=Neobacillus ginsengisoli TaxID=904295 RepID=A0ABT9XQW2_9BACI|nr:ribbon-helix-helix domain-containing protein [Neobacillus ginsengisoli]MDQ0197943.1 putative DNA-binding protein [Neobacillus ginsengisoli]
MDGQNNRGLKTRRTISNAIDIELYEQLEKLSIDTRIPKSKLLDEAIRDLINKHSNKSGQ